MSKHYSYRRYRREWIIQHILHGDGKIIDGFIVNRGHKHGVEVHSITENGVILIHNYDSGILCTKIIARPEQIKRYYRGTDRECPIELNRVLKLCEWHKNLHYNSI